MKPKTKVVGRRDSRRPLSPGEAYRKSLALIRLVDSVNPYPRPRGFVFKARTFEEYEQWRKNQKNPRLW